MPQSIYRFAFLIAGMTLLGAGLAMAGALGLGAGLIIGAGGTTILYALTAIRS